MNKYINKKGLLSRKRKHRSLCSFKFQLRMQITIETYIKISFH